MGKGDDARNGIEYLLSFQNPNGKFGKLSSDFWKENGIVLWASVRHAMLTQDKVWLKSVWEKLSKTVDYIGELRKMTLQNTIPPDDGLIPPGKIDGGLTGGEDIAEYTNIYWNLIGLKVVINAAHWIGNEEIDYVFKACEACQIESDHLNPISECSGLIMEGFCFRTYQIITNTS